MPLEAEAGAKEMGVDLDKRFVQIWIAAQYGIGQPVLVVQCVQVAARSFEPRALGHRHRPPARDRGIGDWRRASPNWRGYPWPMAAICAHRPDPRPGPGQESVHQVYDLDDRPARRARQPSVRNKDSQRLMRNPRPLPLTVTAPDRTVRLVRSGQIDIT